jgi:hypothetical protein
MQYPSWPPVAESLMIAFVDLAHIILGRAVVLQVGQQIDLVVIPRSAEANISGYLIGLSSRSPKRPQRGLPRQDQSRQTNRIACSRQTGRCYSAVSSSRHGPPCAHQMAAPARIDLNAGLIGTNTFGIVGRFWSPSMTAIGTWNEIANVPGIVVLPEPGSTQD